MGLQDLGAGVGSWVGSLLAEGPASEEEARVYNLLTANMDEFGNIDPNVLKNVEAVVQQDSGLSKFKEDARLRDAQLGALTRLQQVASEGGMTAIDRARLNDINNNINQQQQARRQAMMTSAAQRGQMGSGLMYANMLGSEQAANEAASQQGFDVAADAQKRALDAMLGAGKMGGDIRGQDFDIAAQRASAQDRINQYNAELRNQMNRYNMDNRQRNFQNRMDVGKQRNAGRSDVAGYHQAKADNIRNQYQQAGTAIGGTLGAGGDVAMNVMTGGASGAVDSFGKNKFDKSSGSYQGDAGFGSGKNGRLR